MKKRILALTLTAALTLGLAAPASAAELSAACDETYYATLDYYGAPLEASVVKSYRLNGQRSVTDYGDYDSVVNLTDASVPVQEGGKLTFTPEEGTEKFYFEGKTTRPFEELPWTISVSYKLNGAPILAEDLAGKTGLVEIDLDVVPNPRAPDYTRTNLVLTAATAFNDDDITSLEAPGAEVQLIGNLRAVLFAVLPGEEQHFAIRVGCDSFECSGLILMAVPATLQQLDQVADLKDAKEETEDSLDAIDESLDVILDTLEGMSGSLNATANGLDQLNAVRGNVSAEKGKVYDKTDLALADIDALADTLGTLDPHLSQVSQAASDALEAADALSASVLELKDPLARSRELIGRVQEEVSALKELAETAEGYNDEENRKLMADLARDAKGLGSDMEELRDKLNALYINLEFIEGLSKVSDAEINGVVSNAAVEIGGEHLSVVEIQRRAALAAEFQKAYYAATGTAMPTDGSAESQQAIGNFLAQYYMSKGVTDPADLQKRVQDAAGILTFVAANRAQLESMDAGLKGNQNSMASALTILNKRIDEANGIITRLSDPTAELVEQLRYLCDSLGKKGLSGHLQTLAEEGASLMEDMAQHQGELPALMEKLNEAGDLLSEAGGQMEEVLDRADDLVKVADAYEPDLQAALTDVTTLSGSAQSTLHDTKAALASAEELLRRNGSGLDEGASQSLSGLAAALRKSTQGLDRTSVIRNAKTTINDLVDDKWNEHSGEVDGLLNIDAGAVPVSMTSEKNPAPTNIQYIMRTQEIKVEDSGETAPEVREQEQTRSFWQRVKDLFVGLWNDIVGFFTGKK